MKFLLDEIGGTVAWAHGLHQMTVRYRGPIINVREDGTDTNADIGSVNGILDCEALRDHCGANDGWIEDWYDLSGEGGVSLNQSDHTKQYKIWDGTSQQPTIEPSTGRIAAEIPATQAFYAKATPSLSSADYTLAAVFRLDNIADFTQSFWDGNTNAAFTALNGSTTAVIASSGGNKSLEVWPTSLSRYVWSDTKYRLNNDSADQAVDSVTHTLDGLTLGELRSASRGLNYHIDGGHWLSIVAWDDDTLALADIQSWLNDYYLSRVDPAIPRMPKQRIY